MFSDKVKFKELFIEKLQTMHGKSLKEASMNDKYSALAALVRDYISKNWVLTNNQYHDNDVKQVYYLSIEFLVGRLLGTNLLNIGVAMENVREALAELDVNLEELCQQEPEPGLGNGGLGRLAACFLDSMAALNIPGHGCGIRYKYGLFEQKIVDAYQVELPDYWLKDGYIWEYRKPDKAVEIRFGGNVYLEDKQDGDYDVIHQNYESVSAVPYDVPVVGYQNKTVNTLRLWSAEPIETAFDLSSFNHGDYMKAVEYKQSVEKISTILYPEDNHYEGRLLRLKQQYFFVAASLQSIIRRFKREYDGDFENFAKCFAVHINDTHPALAIPELMRLLMDVEKLGWEKAWEITIATISYTNHTIMPEALEKWPTSMISNLLPRIFMITKEIDNRLRAEIIAKYGEDAGKLHDLGIIVDDQVHMARLAVVGSHSVNGVAKIHTDILKNHLFKGYNDFYPHKINSKTNGITHRRWLLKANPGLAATISEAISDSWIKQPAHLKNLLQYAEDASFQDKIADIKYQNKAALARHVKEKYNIMLNPSSIFDVQVKRIHSYKRQLLNVLHIMDLYNRLLENPDLPMTPRTFIFAGKAASGYYIAKQTIKLINVLADVINKDKTIQDKLKVVFLENYSVSLAELIIPAADVSEQISTASKEASGTGNMKLMMNGAITLGTLDGANIEIRDAVGDDNIIIFGMTAEQVMDYYEHGGYNAWDIYHQDPRVAKIMEQIGNGFFPQHGGDFRSLYENLLNYNDEYFVLKDFATYVDAHKRLQEKYNDMALWRKMSVHNIAHAGIFSSDRTIAEYANCIWNVKPEIIK